MGNISLKEMNDSKVEKMESNFNHNDSFEMTPKEMTT